jgi:DMSO/TMAO reductase YedYZ molybdopterin-dependent catalytic subunit
VKEPSEAADKAVESPRQEPRLPPGQILTDKWPVLHYGSVARADLALWDFRVWGEVAEPRRWSHEEFLALPQTRVRSDIHCVTRWSRFDNLWQGIAAREVLERVKPRPDARFVIVHAEQGYTANLPVEQLGKDGVLFAHKHNGQDLTAEHGWPLRLVVPHRYFWKSAKWVRGLEFVREDRPGFWEQNGYHNDADPWNEERFSDW